MKITKTIPETDEVQYIRRMIFNLETKECLVQIEYGDSDTPLRITPLNVDFSSQWDAATTTQKNTIKKFFKQIMAIAWDMLETEIPDTVFEPNI